MTANKRIQHIAIVGGGTAGWMTAAALSRVLLPENVKITLIESEQIGTIGVGEATIPDVANFNRMLGINEAAFMKATNGTFKLGIEFRDWGKIGDSYFHPFGEHGVAMNGIDFHQYWLHSREQGNPKPLEDYSICAVAAQQGKFSPPDNNPRSVMSHLRYAYHFDATAYASFLRQYAEKNGVIRVEGKVEQVGVSSESGNISHVLLDDGRCLDADFFFDCSGFRALLLEKTLGVKFHDWSHWLPCNSAQAVATERTEPLLPYTVSTAKSAGWQWRIPTQHRTGNGHIYCTDFMSDDAAHDVLLAGLDAKPTTEPRTIRFKTGYRNELWNKNCVGIGLAGGFLEPLESTSIFLIQQGITRFISLYPSGDISPVVRDEYNRLMTREFHQVRDFIILHYKATTRDDSEFWNYCRTMSIPDSLQQKIDLFKAGGRVFRDSDELFSRPSWIAVMLGQNIIPNFSDPILSGIPAEQIAQSLGSMNQAMKQTVAGLPTHTDFVAKHVRGNDL
ncbi:tryptophan 7-halogenase [Alteromonas sp. 5E99-2]|uniref:tryptophan halogenase family protein n=1 Tax=Alteromonas sp. 5E99-2 TaxID=2817683 RepID=UPI001A983472|nr:tryptophan halogenase family protein [Alteromonas sp. 5E99-2]MBO1256820.1 tryptophan 7-halogenase [Alteromonas sp. 5E99-2]